MAEWVDIPLATQMGEDGSTYVSDMELTNLHLVENPPGSRTPFHISSVPTLSTTGVSLPTTGFIRGMATAGGAIGLVQGTSVYWGTPALWFAAGGGSMAGTGAVRIADAGTHFVMVDGTNARALDIPGLVAVNTPSIEGWIDATYQDGYTIYADSGSQSFSVSSLDDPLTVSALNFTTADAHPGNIVGIASVNRELSVIKAGTTEYYFNVGGAGFPFQRSTPGVVERGAFTSATNTVQEQDGAVYFLGNDIRVYALRGYQIQPISTSWVDRYMRANMAGTLFGSAYKLDGVGYYTLSGFLESGTRMALVCNLKTGLWHKRYSSISAALQLTHMVTCPSQLSLTSNVVVAGRDIGTGNSALYVLDPSGTNDSGASGQVTRVMTLPQIEYGNRRTFMSELEIDMAKPATTGTITCSWSDDGGATYSTGITNTGANQRVRFQRLGSFYRRILRLTFSIASKISIIGVRARIEVGA